jgi:hypothetical protein
MTIRTNIKFNCGIQKCKGKSDRSAEYEDFLPGTYGCEKSIPITNLVKVDFTSMEVSSGKH